MKRQPPRKQPGSRAKPRGRTDEAEAWFLRRRAGLAPDEAAAFEHWLSEDPAHATAFTEVGELWNDLGHGLSTETRARRSGFSPARRRFIWGAAAGTGGLIAAGIAGVSLSASDRIKAPVGSQLRLRLARGNRLMLAAGSEVQLEQPGSGPAQPPDAQGLRLLRGAALIEVSQDVERFRLRVGDLHLTAGPGQFALQTWSDLSEASCLSGRMKLGGQMAGQSAGQSAGQEVASGQLVQIAAHEPALIRPAGQQDNAWLSGRIICDGTPLYRLAEDLDRQRRGELLLDPAIRDLRVTGTFRTDAAEETIVALTRILPVRRVDLGPWLTLLRRA